MSKNVKEPLVDKKNRKNVINLKENKLLAENPLVVSPVISANNEIEQKVSLVEEIESLVVLSKQQLMAKRQRVELEVDNAKLEVAKKTISNIDKIINMVASEEVLERVKENIKTPQDMKYMAEAAEKLTSTLKNLMNPNVQDEFGGRKRIKIAAQFQTPSGDTASIGVSVDSD